MINKLRDKQIVSSRTERKHQSGGDERTFVTVNFQEVSCCHGEEAILGEIRGVDVWNLHFCYLQECSTQPTRERCAWLHEIENTGQMKETYQLHLQHLVIVGKVVRELMGPGTDCMHVFTIYPKGWMRAWPYNSNTIPKLSCENIHTTVATI